MRTPKPHVRATAAEPIWIAPRGACAPGSTKAISSADGPQPEALLNLVRALAREVAAEAVRIAAADMAAGEPEPSEGQP